MTEAITEQTVVEESKAPAQPDAAETSARETDDLDALLKEYETSARPPETQPEPKAAPQKTDSGAELSDVRQYIFNQDMEKTIGKVRGGLDPDYFDDKLVKGWINEQAIDDPRLATAWQQRYANPKQYQKVVDQLSQKFAKKYGKMHDREATENREVVAAAVRGASTKAPEHKAPDYSNMSNPEYRQKVKQEYGFDPGV